MNHPARFSHLWRAEILPAPPLIAPARQFVYPRQIPGEEDALARGALQVLVHPATGGSFVATFALGFTGPGLPTGVWPCPNPHQLCALAGGYAYLLDTADPAHSHLLPLRPVVEVRPLPSEALLLFVGLHAIAAWGPNGLAWQTARLTWEGVRVTACESGRLLGFGWDLPTDRDVAFTVDLRTGAHTGGASPAGPASSPASAQKPAAAV
ncbi:MAG: hypothetical protein M3O02_13265 [Acidobacteriota bacterium]|nr:hypothetical protein [Acidobacteriota bacterium]